MITLADRNFKHLALKFSVESKQTGALYRNFLPENRSDRRFVTPGRVQR